MKDTIIKETGNSRFLRSSVSQDITFSEFITLLRAGQLPIDLAGINADGIDVLGMALNKENILPDETESFLFGNTADRTISEAFLRLAPWRLIDTIDNTVGYSGEWTAPDVFGDRSAYDLGVYMIGGGKSGGAHVSLYKLDSDSDSHSERTYGGSSGYGRNVIFRNISPGTKYPFVIGTGGPAVVGTRKTKGNYTYDGVAGGSTAFGGITAPGGGSINELEGGQPSSTYIDDPAHYYGGVPCRAQNYTYVLLSQGEDSQNVFDPTMISLARGMNAYGYIYYASSSDKRTNKTEEVGAFGNPTIGTIGTAKAIASFSGSAITATAGSGTHGNGGGAAVAMQGASESAVVIATSGAGGDGVIFLYARKAVS